MSDSKKITDTISDFRPFTLHDLVFIFWEKCYKDDNSNEYQPIFSYIKRYIKYLSELDSNFFPELSSHNEGKNNITYDSI